MILNCADGNGQLPTSVQPLLRLLDTCLLHTRQVLHTLLRIHSSQHTQQSAYTAVSIHSSQHCNIILVVLGCHHSCACSHGHFLANHRLQLLQSCYNCSCKLRLSTIQHQQLSTIQHQQLFICMPEMQAVSFSWHTELSLNVKVGMSDDHNLLTATKVQPCVDSVFHGFRSKHVLTRCFMFSQANVW